MITEFEVLRRFAYRNERWGEPQPGEREASWMPMLYRALQPASSGTDDSRPTSLLTEVLRDGSSNCLEKAVLWADPSRHELVFMDSTDGGPGHVLIRDKATGKVWDVNDGYPPADVRDWHVDSADAWIDLQGTVGPARGSFTVAGVVQVDDVHALLSADPSMRRSILMEPENHDLRRLAHHRYALALGQTWMLSALETTAADPERYEFVFFGDRCYLHDLETDRIIELTGDVIPPDPGDWNQGSYAEFLETVPTHELEDLAHLSAGHVRYLMNLRIDDRLRAVLGSDVFLSEGAFTWLIGELEEAVVSPLRFKQPGSGGLWFVWATNASGAGAFVPANQVSVPLSRVDEARLRDFVERYLASANPDDDAELDRHWESLTPLQRAYFGAWQISAFTPEPSLDFTGNLDNIPGIPPDLDTYYHEPGTTPAISFDDYIALVRSSAYRYEEPDSAENDNPNLPSTSGRYRAAADHFEEWERNGPGPDEDDEGAAGAVLAGLRAADPNGDPLIDADELVAYAATQGFTLSEGQAQMLVLAYAAPGEAGVDEGGLAAMFRDGVLVADDASGATTIDLAALPAERLAHAVVVAGDADGDGALSQEEFAQALKLLGGVAPSKGSLEANFELYQQGGYLEWAQLANMVLDGNLHMPPGNDQFYFEQNGKTAVSDIAPRLLDREGVISLFRDVYGIELTAEQAQSLIDAYGDGSMLGEGDLHAMMVDGVLDPLAVRRGGGIHDLAEQVIDPPEQLKLQHPELIFTALEYAQRLQNGETIQDILGDAPTQEQQDAMGDALELLGISNRQVELYAQAADAGVPGADQALRAAAAMRYAIDEASGDSWAHVNKPTTPHIEQDSAFDVFGFKGFVQACTSVHKGDWYELSETNTFLKEHVPALDGASTDAELRATGLQWLFRTGVNEQFSQPGVSGVNFESILEQFSAAKAGEQFLAACGVQELDAEGLGLAIYGSTQLSEPQRALMALYVQKYGRDGVLDAASVQAMMDDGALAIDAKSGRYVLKLDPLLQDPTALDQLVIILLSRGNTKSEINDTYRSLTGKGLFSGGELFLASLQLWWRQNPDELKALLLDGQHTVGGPVDLSPTDEQVTTPAQAPDSLLGLGLSFLVTAFSQKALSSTGHTELRRRTLELEDGAQGDHHSAADEAAIVYFLDTQGLAFMLDDPVFRSAFLAASRAGASDAECLAYAQAARDAGFDEATAEALATHIGVDLAPTDMANPVYMRALLQSYQHYKSDMLYTDAGAADRAVADTNALMHGVGSGGTGVPGLYALLSDNSPQPGLRDVFVRELQANGGNVWDAYAQATALPAQLAQIGDGNGSLANWELAEAVGCDIPTADRLMALYGQDGVVSAEGLRAAFDDGVLVQSEDGSVKVDFTRLLELSPQLNGELPGKLTIWDLQAMLSAHGQEVPIETLELLLNMYDVLPYGVYGVFDRDEVLEMLRDGVLVLDEHTGAPAGLYMSEVPAQRYAAALVRLGSADGDPMLNNAELVDALSLFGLDIDIDRADWLIDRFGNGDVVDENALFAMLEQGVLWVNDGGQLDSLLPEEVEG